MKKRTLLWKRVACAVLFILLLGVAGMAKALSSLTQAVDFTATDYDGDEAHLSDIFNSGKNDVIIHETFGEYTVGNKIAQDAIAHGNDWWTTWSNVPGGSEDGVVATYNGNKCGHLVYGNDQVLLLGDEDNGNYDLEFDILVPEGKNGYFNILHHFAGANSTWAMQCYLHLANDGQNSTSAPGHGTIHAGSNNTADVACVYDAWMHFRLNVDTDTDVARYYYTAPGQNEVLVCQWQWSLDSYGNNVVGRTLAAMDFYPSQNASTSEFYLDNFSFKRLSGESAPLLSITPNAIEETLGEDDMTTLDITIQNNGNSIGEWNGWIEFGQGGAGSQTAQLYYHNDDTSVASGIGSSDAYTREFGIRLPANAYAGTSMGMRITSANFYVNTYTAADHNYTFRIYGQGLNNQPGELLAEKTINTSVTEQWITATFDNPVYMTGQTFWATIQLEQAAAEYPMTMDGGEYGEVADGNWLSTNGNNFSHCYSYGSFGGAWMISVNCEGQLIPATWASINQTGGSILGGYSEYITLTLNTIGLSQGTYTANLVVNTNDANHPHIEVPITLHNNTSGGSYTITAAANPSIGGSVTGSGYYQSGQTCTLTATANSGYAFVNWTENGTQVSTNPTYTFTVTGNRNLVANFEEVGGGYHWDVNIHTYPNTLIMVGVVLINGEEQATDMLEVGAFCNGECRGRERLSGQYYQIFGRYFVNLTVYGEDGDEISFRLYDHATETELDLTCAPITFTTNGVFGNPVNPHVLDFGPSAITQTTDFAEGWNWWSTYIDQTGIDGLTMLEEGLGGNGVTVKSQGDGFVQYMNYGGYTFWYGTLDHIANSQTYMVQTDAAVQAEMTGASVSPADSPITISEGWNWIGFPSANAMDFNTAFSGITPSNNDIVKTQNSFAQYMVYGSYSFWYGELSNSVITPGTGLMYKSENSGSYTFTYPTTGRATAPAVPTAGKHWTNNVHAYPTNMTVLAVVELNDIELRSDNYELAAFANGECRGSAKLMYVEPLNRYMAFLTVSGNEAAELHFGLYDAETGEENYTSSDKLVYATDAAVGSYDEPMVVSFRSTTGLDAIERDLQVYPNPVERGERFSINLPVGSEVRVEVVNALGAFVSTETSTKAPASLLAPNTAGVYTLRITVEGEGTYCRKLVVR